MKEKMKEAEKKALLRVNQAEERALPPLFSLHIRWLAVYTKSNSRGNKGPKKGINKEVDYCFLVFSLQSRVQQLFFSSFSLGSWRV